MRTETILHGVGLFLVSMLTGSAATDNATVCWFTEFQGTRIPDTGHSNENTQKEVEHSCEQNYACKAYYAISAAPHMLHTTEADVFRLNPSKNSSDTVWFKTCPKKRTFRKISVPLGQSYYEPILQGSQISLMKEVPNIQLKVTNRDEKRRRLLTTTKHDVEETFMLQNYAIRVTNIALEKRRILEAPIKSWCTYSPCEISPRTYFHAITPTLSLVGVTDSTGQGHVMIIENGEVLKTVYPAVDGKPGIIGGVWGFFDGRFAVSVFVDDEDILKRRMYLQLYRKDFSMEWTTHLHSEIGVPDRNVGDFRLSYGSGYFSVFISVYGIANFANGTNGEQLYFVNDQGKMMTTSHMIPGQNFIKNGHQWGCSHSLGQLVNFHPYIEQFLTICAADLFPSGISAGNPETGSLLVRSKGNGFGYTSAQIGQIAPSTYGWKLLFNAKDFDCCESNGIGFISIYNEVDEFTGQQSFDEVVWLTKSKGLYERDPAMARYFPDGGREPNREFYLVGWYDTQLDDYFLGTVDKFGSFVQTPVPASSVNGGGVVCNGNCVAWGNRDESFQTLPDGSVGWVLAQPGSGSVWLYRVSPKSRAKRAVNSVWSIWSGWTICSRSCGGGETLRMRACLGSGSAQNKNECRGKATEMKACNIDDCTVPLTCSFDETTDVFLVGNLHINQKLQFGYSEIAAREKCREFRDVCWGFAEEVVNGFPFYVLKTSQSSVREDDAFRKASMGYIMTCRETPGWSDWSTWFACSATCGGGVHVRTRFCDGEKKGSAVCRGPDSSSGACNTGRCPTWSPWSTWSDCSQSCNEGMQARNRTCEGDYPEGCEYLPGPANETQACSQGECARWSIWSTWSTCDNTCGNGTRSRTRECLGDFPCPADDKPEEFEICTLGRCAFWKEWGQWGSCTVTCGGGGIHRRSRQCGGDFPELCEESGFISSESCSVDRKCPKWGNWSLWTPCSATCDGGQKSRTQTCAALILSTCERAGSVSPKNATYPTSRSPMGEMFVKTETQGCTLGACSFWENWGSWTDCSASCDNGTQIRSRTCFGDFPDMCMDTGEPLDYRACNLGSCGVWLEWSSWGKCSATCGAGTWKRARLCIGDFKATCVGSESEVTPCDIGDCTAECESRPCNNSGQCRLNEYLTRRYHCSCADGWIGKHCDYLGPEIHCGRNSIVVEMDQRAITDENLINEAQFVTLSGFSGVDECTARATVDSLTLLEVYHLTVPAPMDVSCGSQMETHEDEIRLKNRVVWKVEDEYIQSEVIMLDFTCVYKTTAETMATNIFGAPLRIESFKKEIEIIEGYAKFVAVISLFRDPNFRIPIRGDFGRLVKLAEGQIIYLSVDLREAEVRKDEVNLVMKNCFVTADSTSDGQGQRPIVYLLRDGCPMNPFVRVLSNGQGVSGRMSIRVFGWTGKKQRAENLYLHCTVDVCDAQANSCVPECETARRRRKRSSDDVFYNDAKKDHSLITTQHDVTKPFPSVIVDADVDQPLLSSTEQGSITFATEHMVSEGPILVDLGSNGGIEFVNSRMKRCAPP